MIETSAWSTHHIASHVANGPNGGPPDVSMGNRYGELCHGQSDRTLYGDTGYPTRVRSCPPDNIGWAVTPPAYDQRLVGNWLRDIRYPLPLPIS